MLPEVTMLNVISVLNEAVGGDLSRVKQCVQLTGILIQKMITPSMQIS
jgi:NAD(P)H dehydrogenase (quinone)